MNKYFSSRKSVVFVSTHHIICAKKTFILELYNKEICKLACLEEVKIFDKSFNLDLNYFVAVNEYSKIYVITESLIDKDLELKKLNKELPSDPDIPLLSIYPEELKAET